MAFVYKVSCLPTKSVYYGISKSALKTYNPVNYFMNCNAEDATTYVSICDSVKTHGRTNHIFQRLSVPKGYELQDFVNKLIEKSKSKGNSLNDYVITNETIVCDSCKKSVRTCFKKRHDERYCVQDEIDGLAELEDYEL